ncbi:MAG: hypothetical protein RBU29_17135 [bacterium]|nr:hypothetical protein [bacterium]
MNQPNALPILLLVGLVTLAACNETKSPPPQQEVSVALAAPLDFQPLAYFENYCARCHGTNGAHYGDEFGKNLTDTELEEFVDEMAAGPGGAPLEGEPLHAMTAFHRSLVTSTPFIILTQTEGNTLRGEAMPDATLSLILGETVVQAERDGNLWTMSLPDSIDSAALPFASLLRAELDGKTTELDLSRKAYSHSEPLQ